jgi:hypothetical protein
VVLHPNSHSATSIFFGFGVPSSISTPTCPQPLIWSTRTNRSSNPLGIVVKAFLFTTLIDVHCSESSPLLQEDGPLDLNNLSPSLEPSLDDGSALEAYNAFRATVVNTCTARIDRMANDHESRFILPYNEWESSLKGVPGDEEACAGPGPVDEKTINGDMVQRWARRCTDVIDLEHTNSLQSQDPTTGLGGQAFSSEDSIESIRFQANAVKLMAINHLQACPGIEIMCSVVSSATHFSILLGNLVMKSTLGIFFHSSSISTSEPSA